KRAAGEARVNEWLLRYVSGTKALVERDIGRKTWTKRYWPDKRVIQSYAISVARVEDVCFWGAVCWNCSGGFGAKPLCPARRGISHRGVVARRPSVSPGRSRREWRLLSLAGQRNRRRRSGDQ